MTPELRAEIEKLIAGVKALGLTWQSNYDGHITCERGDCPMGALIRASKLSEYAQWYRQRFPSADEATVTYTINIGLMPYPETCSKLLGLTQFAAEVVASAADGEPYQDDDTILAVYEDVRQLLKSTLNVQEANANA